MEKNNLIKEQVTEGYSNIAKTGQWSSVISSDSSCCSGGGCCGPVTLTAEQVALAVGYGSKDLENIPSSANMGLSCGNPTAIASLKEGDIVLDLGSGGGFDCFIAGPKVGKSGRVIGVDMTPEMLLKARKNILTYRDQSGLDNVEFRLGEIEHLPVADNSVDVIISNCVINLSPDKEQVFKEIKRVLKPGGRVAISDIALLKPLPAQLVSDIDALIGCVAGASLVSELEMLLNKFLFTKINLVSKSEYIEVMTNSKDPLYVKILENLPAGDKISDYIISLDITAFKS
jgi:arsenite methyltransferase